MVKIKREKVAVAMSGGIDSSVAAFLLQKKYQVFGITMLLGPFGRQTAKNAKSICQKLKIPHYIVNLEKEFKKEIIQPFCREYANGITPNPCVWCNEKIKFGILLKKAKELGAKYLATGHYARLRREIPNSKFQISNKFKIINSKNQTIYKLLKAKDKSRDQSYFLYRLKQNQLRKVIFPLGDLTKDEVKKIAVKNRLMIRKQKESREICFIPDNNYRQFLKRSLQKKIKRGPIKDLKNRIVGEHQGLPFYTIGQRRGLIRGQKNPVYVIKVDRKSNTLIVGQKKDLYQKRVILKDINWLTGKKLNKGEEVMVKIRYRHPAVLARILRQIKSSRGLEMEFKKPQRAVTPGQSAVFYSDDEILGGGIISPGSSPGSDPINIHSKSRISKEL